MHSKPECDIISAKAMSRAETDKAEIAHACMRAISELDGSIGRSPRTRETQFPECSGEAAQRAADAGQSDKAECSGENMRESSAPAQSPGDPTKREIVP